MTEVIDTPMMEAAGWEESPPLPKPLTDMQAMAALYRKKTAVTALLAGGVPKDGTHPKFKFIDASDAKKAIGQAMAEVGLSLHMSAAEHKRIPLPANNGKEADLLNVWFYMTLCDAETGATETTMWLGEANLYGHDDRGFAKASTSAEKSFLLATFMVGDKDDDKPAQRSQQSRQSSERPQTPPALQDKPQAATPTPPAAKADVPLSSLDEDKWPKFLGWAKDKFNYDPPLVDAALAFMMGSDGHYKGSRDMAMGAVLAMACGYDADVIRDTGERKKLPDAVMDEAVLIPKPEISR
jgi:hypothetical protein